MRIFGIGQVTCLAVASVACHGGANLVNDAASTDGGETAQDAASVDAEEAGAEPDGDGGATFAPCEDYEPPPLNDTTDECSFAPERGVRFDMRGCDLSGDDFREIIDALPTDSSGDRQSLYLQGRRLYDLAACPRSLEAAGLRCLPQPFAEPLDQPHFMIPVPAPDLRGANLRYMDFSAINFAGGDFECATLNSTLLTNTNFLAADLRRADLTNADLRRAQLYRAHTTDLSGCPRILPSPSFGCGPAGPPGRFALTGPGLNLSESDLAGADLAQVDLVQVRAVGVSRCPATLPEGWRCVETPQQQGLHVLAGPIADLSQYDLDGIDLRGADLRATALGGSSLRDADLSDARFYLEAGTFDAPWGTGPAGADFNAAKLDGANLRNADLRSATFDSASLEAADLRDADLRGATFLANAKLGRADLRGAQLSGATFSLYPDCPEHLPNGWACRPVPFAVTRFSAVTETPPAVEFRDCPGAGECPMYSLLGPGVRLYTPLFTNRSLIQGVSLEGIDLTDATFPPRENNVLTPTEGAKAIGLTGCSNYPAEGGPRVGASLPVTCVHTPRSGGYALVGGGMAFDLRDADFTDVDLSSTALGYNTLFDLKGCPAVLPDTALFPYERWTCVAQPANGRYALIRPDINRLFGADLSGADLQGLEMTHSTFFEARLVGANLRGANLQASALSSADLTSADLSGANLEAAAMSGTILTNTNLSGANLEFAWVHDALWSHTICPDGTNSDDHGGTCLEHLVLAP